MQHLVKTFLLGLATILPVALTLYLVYFLAIGAERFTGGILKFLLPDIYYWPGMGLILSLVAITLIGFLVRIPGLDWLLRLNDAVMTRLPLIKTVYSTIRDFMDMIAAANKDKKIGKPVSVRIQDEIELFGLVTNSDLGDNKALVYLPMSYQLGGYTVILDKDRLEYLDMSVEDALRYIVTAGIQQTRTRKIDQNSKQ